MFMAEKGVEVPVEDIDIVAGKNREPEYLAKNPHGTCPALELDNGACVSEITAICEYLEELHPENPLLGTTPEERAEARMWARRVDLYICEPMGNGFRFGKGLGMFKNRIHTIPEAAEGLQASASDRLAWLDGQMEGRDYLCGAGSPWPTSSFTRTSSASSPRAAARPGPQEHRGVARAGG